MKNVFSINITTNETEADKFAARKISDELQRKTDEMDETISSIQDSAAIPAWLTIVAYICGGFAAIVIMNFISSAIKGEFAQAYENAGWLIYAGAVCLVFAIVVAVYKRYKYKSTENAPAVQSAIAQSEKLTERCYEDLGVPDGAGNIDIFIEAFKSKNGKVKKATSLFRYLNIDCKIYRDDYNLYLADISKVYAFPLSNLKEIVAVNKNATFNGWHKQEPFNKGYYKQFKIKCNNYGTFFVKPHYSIRFTAFGEEYEIVIPGYELENFKKYVNLNVTGEIK